MSVYKRNRRWWCDFTISGVRYRQPMPEARLKPDAERRESEIKLEIYDGIYERRKPVLFSEFIESEYLPFAKANYRSRSYESAVKVLVAFFGNYRLKEISPLLVEKFKRERMNSQTRFERPRAAASVAHELSFLSKVLNLAADSGFIRDNPCGKVKKPKVNNSRDRVLTDAEETLLLSKTDERMQRIVIFALNTGMRRGEIAALDWRDIDRQGESIRLTQTKSGKGRTVPINDKARAAIGEAADVGSIFKWKATTLSQKFNQAREDAELENLHFHDLRHTFATRLGLDGVDVFTIAEILGHSDIKMTRRYTHSSEESKRQAVSSLDSRHKSVTSIFERRSKAG